MQFTQVALVDLFNEQYFYFFDGFFERIVDNSECTNIIMVASYLGFHASIHSSLELNVHE